MVDAGNIFGSEGDDKATSVNGKFALQALGLMGDYILNLTPAEFVFGETFLKENAQKNNITFVSANIVAPQENAFWKPYVIRELGGQKVAITGITILQNKEKTDFYKIEPGIGELKKLLPELNQLSDFVVVLAYTGLQSAQQIARNIDGIDVLLAGGDGGHLSNPISDGKTGAIIGKIDKKCRHVGRIDVTFNPDGEGVTFEGNAIKLKSAIKEDPEIKELEYNLN